MKIKILVSTLLLGILATSCKKKDESTVLTEDEIAEMVAYSISENTYGITSNVSHYSEEINDQLECNTQLSGKSTFQEEDNGLSYSYELNENTLKNCQVDTSISYNFDAFETLYGPHYKWTQNIEGSWTVLKNSTGNIQLNGSYSRNGEWDFHRRAYAAHQMNFQLSLTNVIVSTQSDDILSGSSNFTISGEGARVFPYSNQGTVTYKSSELATIEFSEGRVYELNTSTGLLIRIN